ncbi:nucleoside phosphorylase domain-containing protein [Aspergillus ambiguus]|uniref:nucleoside phosphorylase domain-containing protein n=1 Tax=Aspergillus ambiguus TaxID=176160 RepID=UPI003CCDC4D1
MSCPPLDEYQIGWICALPVEAAAAQEMLDEEFEPMDNQHSADTNLYTLGRIGKHYIVIACLGGQYGTTSATTVANHMMRTFSQSLRVGLMVGIGGAIPSAEKDIRLGDVVVSFPSDTCGGVLQHDMGKTEEGGMLNRIGSLNSPPRLLLGAVNKMRALAMRKDPLYPSYIEQTIQKNARTRQSFSPPDSQTDRLFQIQNRHPPTAATCDDCPAEWEFKRRVRDDKTPQLHYGIIASGNTVIKDGETRERLRKVTGALCFEMEAAGLMQDFPCIVIRGICDYADSHKNKQWQGYAALAAASYAKELLSHVPRGQVPKEDLAANICKSIESMNAQLDKVNQTTNLIQQTVDLTRLRIAEGAAFDSYDNEHGECLEGTRTELLQDIEEWAKAPHGKHIFWLNGMAGTGKSTISRTVAGRLNKQQLLGASFFFKRGEEDRGTAKRLFSTLVEQLIISIPQIAPKVRKAIEDDPKISEKVPREQFEKLLRGPLLQSQQNQNKVSNKVIIIDALDECDREDDIKLILRLLLQVPQSTPFKLRFFLTSRPDLPINLEFKKIDHAYQDLVLHEIPGPVIERDISLYFEHQLSHIRQEHSLPSTWPGDATAKLLIERAIPLFIAAVTLCLFVGDRRWDPQNRLEAIWPEQKGIAATT